MTAFKPNTEPPKTVSVFRNIYQVASDSDKFRRVLWTGRNSQLVIMTIPVGGEIGEETHSVDQHLNFLSGTAQAIIDGGAKETINPGDIVIVPAGTLHNFKNTGPTPLIVSTVYAPAEHKADTVHDTMEQGEKLEEEGKDEPPEWAQDLHKKP
ncbi:RmlC-like cupin [Lentinus tigrinus ALCF2SS1-7]|uniref:RmlC-like cupin n=1 Tax=Lentinus tigrinus ALCF2SS1-7 TaxID=1328758 RepID=UPI0011663AC7|nr:RmlC-like cupin [Lentinus tigrinus ALCF2SS1-7]